MANPNEDLAYIKEMAEKGRSMPLVGGEHFLLWGVLIGSAGLVQYLRDQGHLHLPFSMAWFWTGVLVLGWVVGFWLGRKTAHHEGSHSFSNQAVTTAWFGCGLFMTTYFFSLLAALYIYRESDMPIGFLFATLYPVAFGLYAVAFSIAATVSGEKWMFIVAFISLILMPALILTIAQDYYLLLAAFGTYGVVAVPGWIMLKKQGKQ